MRGWTGVAKALASGDLRVHLAILVEPYLGLVLRGEKTVESRFAKVRCAPHGCVSREDLVLLKRSGGPVVGAFLVGSVWPFELDRTAWGEIRERFASAICPQEDDFWQSREAARYATLMEIVRPVSIPPVDWPKRDRRGWVVVCPGRQP